MLKIEFHTNSAEFGENGELKEIAVVGLLHKIGEAVKEGHTDGAVFDGNGNNIGTWSLT
jgi:hypothetical protein